MYVCVCVCTNGADINGNVVLSGRRVYVCSQNLSLVEMCVLLYLQTRYYKTKLFILLVICLYTML